MNTGLFFAYENTIVEQYPDAGFELYGTAHLIWLAAILAAAVFMGAYYKKQNQRRQDAVKKFFAAAILIAEIVRDAVLIATGAPILQELPLHLCGLAIFAMLIDAFGKIRSKGERLFLPPNARKPATGFFKQTMAYAFMPGAVAALLFCDWTMYPLFNYMNIYSFIFHGWIVIYFYMQYTAGEIRVNYRGLWKICGAIAVISVPMYFLNVALSTNYLFLNEASAGSPLALLWDVFGTRFGQAGYLVSFAVLVVVVLHVLYAVYMIIDKIFHKEEGNRR